MTLISSFDPWRSGLCTCPSKLTFNPYTGCDHHCLYCYATSYIPNFKQIHPKKDCLAMLRREAIKLNGQTISLSNSSDPYPKMDATEGLTRRCLEILAGCNCQLQIITKSNLVTRDDDLLCQVPATVALTITTDNEFIANIIEPNAPTPNQRIRAAQELQKAGIPVSVRIDPLIPHINDQPQKLIKTLADIGVKHITCSTYKAKPDNWNRLYQALPKVMEQLKPLYSAEGEKVGGSTLLPNEYRYKLLKNIRDTVLAQGMQFGVCREALHGLSTAACDGSWLMPQRSP
ncbi:radical SAM protein [Candidatus Bathycorpusculum sp.]|uniref:SPL family radical SAM protein n=1 Tax=Candidatus Bathycorpusculum sp. TaxID=2994959 RepID=UPI002825C7C0|nr:radical SAM protein [Candidatus Termitimicrobium sp.]MCL2686441.1 radical SAM protein [Candidatus Termitimicrobium sp.]